MHLLRTVWHAIVAVLGWILFASLWWYAFSERSPKVGEFHDLGLVGITFLVALVLSATWVAWNVHLYRSKEPRTQAPKVAYDYSVDATGRPVEADFDSLRNERYIVVGLVTSPEGETKTYAVGSAELTEEEVAACSI